MDISKLFVPGFNSFSYITAYMSAYPSCVPALVNQRVDDLRAIANRQFGVVVSSTCTVDEVVCGQLSDTFWEVQLPQSLVTTNTRTGDWLAYCAAQVRAADNALFSGSFKV